MNENGIMNELDFIDYGWVDKNNNIHKIVDEAFSSNYKLQSPKEVVQNKIGVCWDQVELERYLFDNTNLSYKTYFIVHYDNNKCPTHTFLMYEKNNKVYWFEHSWSKYKGIHKYNSMNELIKDVKHKFISTELNSSYDEMNLVIYEYTKPKYGISVSEFYKHCETGKQVDQKELI
jgi:hypothetical protein